MKAIKPKIFQADLDADTFELYQKDDKLAVDCEMMGLNPRRDRLCVIQIANSTNHFSLIQVLPEQNNAPNIQSLFENPEIMKIFHFARTDMQFLKTFLGINVQSVFCTKISSKLARTYTDRHGLKEVIREFFNEHIDKRTQSSDWGRKILSKEQIDYATEDVRFLISIQYFLTEILIRENRFEIAQNCFKFLPTLIQMDYLDLKDILEH